MSEQARCCRCGAVLSKDEVAMTRKTVNRGTESFFCYACLSDHFRIPVETLKAKAEEFRAMGCTLFS